MSLRYQSAVRNSSSVTGMAPPNMLTMKISVMLLGSIQNGSKICAASHSFMMGCVANKNFFAFSMPSFGTFVKLPVMVSLPHVGCPAVAFKQLPERPASSDISDQD